MFDCRAVTVLLVLGCVLGLAQPSAGQGNAPTDGVLFNDVHFHLANYVQRGLTAKQLLERMGDKAGRVALFGIPLQQKWDYFVSGDREPTYYLHSDASLYYYSMVDAIIASEYLGLSDEQKKRFDPMITGFNPTDMHAVDHIKLLLKMYPGVFSGIGEFSVHKEFVSPKITGHTASLENKALDAILTLAGEIGLLVILHNDIGMVRPLSGDRPAHFDQLKELFRRHPNTRIIWAHTGLGRFVSPRPNHLALLEEFTGDQAFSHIYFDISWDEVARWIVKDDETVKAWAAFLNKYPDRFLFGTDSVAPKDQAAYLGPYYVYNPLWEILDPAVSKQVRLTNYERLFDAANEKVRAWEARNRTR